MSADVIECRDYRKEYAVSFSAIRIEGTRGEGEAVFKSSFWHSADSYLDYL